MGMFCVKVAATRLSIEHKDATGELVCSALTSYYHYCVEGEQSYLATE